MENQEILKGNKLIAEFMGGEPVNKVKNNPIAYLFPFEFGYKENWDEGGFLGSGKSNCWDINELQYHSSWDWLMDVVEKIEELNGSEFSITISDCICKIDKYDDGKGDFIYFISELNFSKKESVFKAIVRFIEWYNQQSINQNTEQK